MYVVLKVQNGNGSRLVIVFFCVYVSIAKFSHLFTFTYCII